MYNIFHIYKYTRESLFFVTQVGMNISSKEDAKKGIEIIKDLEYNNNIYASTPYRYIKEEYLIEDMNNLCFIKSRKPIYIKQQFTPDKKSLILMKYTKKENVIENNIGKQTTKYYVIPKNWTITKELYERYKNYSFIDFLSAEYFKGEHVIQLCTDNNNLDISSFKVKDIFNEFTHKSCTVYEYNCDTELYFVKENDITEFEYKTKEQVVNENLLDKIFINNLNKILEKYHIDSIKIGGKNNIEYYFSTETLENIALNLFKEKVIPELKSIGIKIERNDLDKFLKRTYSRKVLFNKKQLKVVI